MVIFRIASGVSDHFTARKSEWACAVILFFWGVIVYLPAHTFDNSGAFRVMAQMASEDTWGTAVMTIGTLRLVALIINGTFRRFPYAGHARAATAMLCCFVFLQISLGLLQSGMPTPGLAVYPVLLVLEISNVAAAWSDAVWARTHTDA